jgi:ribosomal protein S18 acetylase RimI-like enzyme
MSRDWPVSQAVEADAPGMASLFVSAWVSPFSRLQLGDIDHNESATAMATRIAKVLKEKQDATYTVIRNPNTKEVVAVAGWTLPTDESAEDRESPEEQEERHALETELYIKRRLRNQILQGEKYYYLNNLATRSDYRGQGLASRLIEDMLCRADADKTLMYLETSSDNPAVRMYKRLGFEEQGKWVVKDLSKFASKEELERCDGITEHTHIAFFRRPKESAE